VCLTMKDKKEARIEIQAVFKSNIL
jgi:hypothetical protein